VPSAIEEGFYILPHLHCFLVVVMEKDPLYDTPWLEVMGVVLEKWLP
jgi:hypothetical protein